MSVCHLESMSQSGPVSLAGTSRGMPSTPMKFSPAPKSGLGSLRTHARRIVLQVAPSRVRRSGGVVACITHIKTLFWSCHAL